MKLLSYEHYEQRRAHERDEVEEDHGVKGQEEDAVFS